MTQTATADQAAIDRANAAFWNELCGSTLATALGIKDRSVESLRRFDREFLSMYPYLHRYLPLREMAGQRVLEIGLGYGTVGQQIAEAGARYHAVDIAKGPSEMMAYRLRSIHSAPRVVRASGAELPLASGTFDYVVSIGCFHHTGRLASCLEEAHRVLKPGGVAIVMVYNQFSYQRWLRKPVTMVRALAAELRNAPVEYHGDASERGWHDANRQGVAAPETAFVSSRQARALLRGFSRVDIHTENCDNLVPGGARLGLRKIFLPLLGPAAGLDLYISATK